MTIDILNSWKEIAAYLRISVDYAKALAKKNPDFPVYRDSRMFTTRKALSEWVEDKAKNHAKPPKSIA